ncbi:hypothetical protein PtB15_6B859 [Puccinia triticina]|nr:hypothetical protein PtB15_6B859 [Puccinia triticina]
MDDRTPDVPETSGSSGEEPPQAPSSASSSTPSPTEHEVEQNLPLPPKPLAAPSFHKFALHAALRAGTNPLMPDQSILRTEIQEISPEEFTCSIEAATRSAQEILALKLPRSCKRKAEELVSSLFSRKDRFDATGVISDEEDIKITDLSKAPPPSTTSTATKSRKRAPRVRRKPGSGKAVDLLAKTPNNLSDHPDPGNSKDLAPKLLTPTTSTGDSSASGVAEQLAMKACTQTSAPLPVPNISATPRTESTAGAIAIRAWSPLPSPRPNLSSWDTSLGIGRLTAPDQTAKPAPWPAHDNQPKQPKSPPLFNRESREGSPLPPEQPVQSRTSTTEANNGQPPNATAGSGSGQITIIKSDTIRAQVIDIHQTLEGSKPSWAKYRTTWESLAPLLQHCARAMQVCCPPAPKFHLQRTGGSYASWLETITSLANQFLAPSPHEQWYCPDLIDFPKLTSFGDKDNNLLQGSFIPTVIKSQHPESTLVRCLTRLLHPPQHLHIEWARIITSSVKLIAENLFKPPSFSYHPSADHVTEAVEALEYLDRVKNSSSSFDPSGDSSEPFSQSTPRLHSVNVLHHFRNVIIDVIMAYIIFQTHFLRDAPLTSAQKKANTRAHRPAMNTTPTCASLQKNCTDVSWLPDDPGNHLQKFQRKQNFQPLVYFVLAGVRGLFITSRDHRIAGTSACMSFIQAMSIIKQKTTTIHLPEEPIWKNTSAYLVKIFSPIFQSQDQICPLALVKLPTRFELAEVIANDFLSQWQAWKPTSPFLLPQASEPIIDK